MHRCTPFCENSRSNSLFLGTRIGWKCGEYTGTKSYHDYMQKIWVENSENACWMTLKTLRHGCLISCPNISWTFIGHIKKIIDSCDCLPMFPHNYITTWQFRRVACFQRGLGLAYSQHFDLIGQYQINLMLIDRLLIDLPPPHRANSFKT